MNIQGTIYAVTIKSHDSLFERIYHVLCDSGLNAGEKALILAEKEYTISDLYIEKSPIICYLDGLISSSGNKGALDIVKEQANDSGLWFSAKTAPEAYLQQELRRLHMAIEDRTPAQIIRSLISPSEPAEVGDEERGKLLWHFNKCVSCEFEVEQETIPPERLCPLCQQIRALLRQPRTVSREWAWGWTRDLVNASDASLPLDEIFTKLLKMLAELGYEVKEKAQWK